MLKRRDILMLATLGVLALAACSPRQEEVIGILKRSPAYDSSVPYEHHFGKFLLSGTNGQVYAIREAKGFQVWDSKGNRLSEEDGKYPVHFEAKHRLVGRVMKVSAAERELRPNGKPSELWYPPESTHVIEVEKMIVDEGKVATGIEEAKE